jgi:hypothetical protein
MLSLRSVWRGLVLMRRPYPQPGPGWSVWLAGGWWVHAWTPVWHGGRGPYISVGLGWIAFGRGY